MLTTIWSASLPAADVAAQDTLALSAASSADTQESSDNPADCVGKRGKGAAS
jgi:hypothetical protein